MNRSAAEDVQEGMLLLALALASVQPQTPACAPSPKNLHPYFGQTAVEQMPYTDELGAHLRIEDDFARYRRALKTADAELRSNPKSELLFLLLRDPNVAIREQTLARMMHKRVVPPARLVDGVLQFWSYCDDDRCVARWVERCDGLQVRWARQILARSGSRTSLHSSSATNVASPSSSE